MTDIFLFEFGEDTVCHFKIKGAKYWLFGIWAIPEEDGSITIDLFGEHEWYINKFKPTQTIISERYILKPNGSIDDLEYEFLSSIKNISQIANYPVLGYMKHYWRNSKENPLTMYIKDWTFYKIENPIIEWKENNLNIFLAKIYKVYTKLRWGKFINISIIDNSGEDFKIHPRFELKIEFKQNVDEDIIYYIYHKVNKFKFYKNNCIVCCYEYGSKRSFYYK